MNAAQATADPQVSAAVESVRSSVGVAWLKDCSVVDVTGSDAAAFLQNRLTSDLNALAVGQGQMSAVLDRQAKIQGVFSLHRLGDNHFRLLMDAAEQANAVAQIEKFRILEPVTLQGITNVAVFGIQGPKSPNVLKSLLELAAGQALPKEPYAWNEAQFQSEPLWLTQRSFTGDEGFVALVPNNQADAFWEALQAQAAALNGLAMSEPVRETLRVEAGLPKFGAEYTFDTLLPETGLEQVAVSYSKGCYLGQETVARVKTYGSLQKALVGLLFEPNATLPPNGSSCLLDDKPVGTLTSGVVSPTCKRPIALAYLNKTERVPGKQLTLTIHDQPYSVVVALLPFYQAQVSNLNGQALLDEGLQAFANGEDEDAIRLLRQSVQVQPDLVAAYEALGVILARHEQYEEAVAMMHRVLELEPEHVLAHTNLSVFYLKLGDKDKAEDEKAKATMAAFSKKAKESGLVFDIEAERRKKEQAALERIAMFQEALQFNPTDPLGNFGLGSAFMELKRFEEAIAPLQATIQAQPKHSAAYLSLGKAYESLKRFDEAKHSYQKGIEVAAAKGDLMPLKEMQARLEGLPSV